MLADKAAANAPPPQGWGEARPDDAMRVIDKYILRARFGELSIHVAHRARGWTSRNSRRLREWRRVRFRGARKFVGTAAMHISCVTTAASSGRKGADFGPDDRIDGPTPANGRQFGGSGDHMRTCIFRAAAAFAASYFFVSFPAWGQGDPLLDVDASAILAPLPSRAVPRASRALDGAVADVAPAASDSLDRPISPARQASQGAVVADTRVSPTGARPELVEAQLVDRDVPISPLPAPLRTVVREEIGGWSLRRGETLREALLRWSEQGGYTLLWKADIDFAIEADLDYPAGTRFRDALSQTVQAFWHTPTPLVAHVYSNQVVVITRRSP